MVGGTPSHAFYVIGARRCCLSQCFFPSLLQSGSSLLMWVGTRTVGAFELPLSEFICFGQSLLHISFGVLRRASRRMAASVWFFPPLPRGAMSCGWGHSCVRCAFICLRWRRRGVESPIFAVRGLRYAKKRRVSKSDASTLPTIQMFKHTVCGVPPSPTGPLLSPGKGNEMIESYKHGGSSRGADLKLGSVPGLGCRLFAAFLPCVAKPSLGTRPLLEGKSFPLMLSSALGR
eukprot:jgi/Botrbrau1/6003/Bobra.104_1s0031.1